MSHQQLTRPKQQAAPAPDDAAAGPPSGGGKGLLQQAQAYANVARQARESCQQGAQAEEELHRRRNRSGE